MVPLPPQTPVTPVSIGSNRTKINKMQSKMHKERSGFRSSSVVQITDTTPAISMKTATTKCWTKVTHGLPAQHPPTQREATMHLLTSFITGLRGPQDNIFHSHPTEGVGGCSLGYVGWWLSDDVCRATKNQFEIFCSNLRLRGTPLETKDTCEIIKIMIGLQL